jgi:acetylornithine deacetylase
LTEQIDVVKLTQDLVAMPSESQQSNAEISALLQSVLERICFNVERLAYCDADGVEKVSLVAKKGQGSGGLCLFSHSDTVPGGEGWDALDPQLADGRLYGRGSCDMKGPLAATIAAAAGVDASDLRHPLFIAITADEEQGYGGARQILAQSQIFKSGWPEYGVVAEPTQLIPVYAHKGGARITITAHGVAAHTSTDKGISANFLIAPFLAEMAELAQRFRSDDYFMNPEFDPPTNGFNLIIDDGGTRANVTAARTVAVVGLRSMPGAHYEEAMQLVIDRARAHNLEVDHYTLDPFATAPDSPLVTLACRASGTERAVTVPFGTEAILYKDYMQTVVLGPGNIEQAHTLGEWIDVDQLQRSVDVYAQMIVEVCGRG